jgi:hypothetical protein
MITQARPGPQSRSVLQVPRPMHFVMHVSARCTESENGAHRSRQMGS